MRVRTYGTRLSEEKTHILVTEKSVNCPCVTTLNKASDIARLMCEVYACDRQCEEHIYALCFTAKMYLIGVFPLARGTASSCACGARELFIRLLLAGAVHYILVHNHPSGVPEPSASDKDLTKRIASLSLMMNLPLLDHIIVGENGTFFSFMEAGIMPEKLKEDEIL